MRSAKNKTLVMAVIGLIALASISIAPYAPLKPLIGADGSPLHRPDGTLAMTGDAAAMWSLNWFGYSVLILAVILFAWLLLRIGRSLYSRFRGH